MLIAGLICLGLAVAAIVFHVLERRKLEASKGTETLRCGDLNQLWKGVLDEVGPDSFTHACEVKGPALAAESGALKGPESGAECVWHRTTLTEHYWDWERDSDGRRRRVERTRTLSSTESENPFRVDDGSGTVAIDPREADVDEAEKVVDRMDREPAAVGLLEGLLQVGDRTIGVEHEEWIIRPGAQLYVLGEARDRAGQLALAKPSEGPMVISTQSEEAFQAEARSMMKWSLIAAVVLGPVGIGLLVAAAVTA